MTSLWPQIEPPAARVSKPARYIGCEDDATIPVHDEGRGARFARCSNAGVVVRSQAELANPPRRLRSSEVAAGLGADLEERDPRRHYQWISRHGARWEPLAGPPATTDAPHALERAS